MACQWERAVSVIVEYILVSHNQVALMENLGIEWDTELVLSS